MTLIIDVTDMVQRMVRAVSDILDRVRFEVSRHNCTWVTTDELDNIVEPLIETIRDKIDNVHITREGVRRMLRYMIIGVLLYLAHGEGLRMCIIFNKTWSLRKVTFYRVGQG